MSNVIDLYEWKKRARLGARRTPICRRARPTRREGGDPSFVTIGEVSDALLRRLMRE